ncbi:hypothetical protein B7939_00985 [Eggerthia catenaformis]|nr:hypothetical protein B7939_00985 [Eggerthia catenaformis]
MSMEFKNNAITIKDQISQGILNFLTEASGEVASQSARNSRVRTGQTKSSYIYYIDQASKTSYIGSQLENAIWEEFGTGEYAINGNGRKGGWRYVDKKGKGHFTRGKTPNRPVQRAIESKKAKILKRAAKVIRDNVKG